MPALVIVFAFLAACSTQQPSNNAQTPPAPQPTAVSPAPASAATDTAPIDAGPLAIDATPEERADVRPEINQRFLDPKLDFERWQKTFEGESRETFVARHEVISALGIQAGQSVADIGAGTGFYLWEFAKAVGPSGQVYGVEIAPRFLERMREHVANTPIDNATIIEGTERSVELAEDSVDLVFICDTYHHFEYPKTTLASIRKALRPGGSLVIVDFKHVKGESAKWVLEHVRAGKEVFRREIEAAGFRFDEQPTITGFKDNYMIRFRRD